MRYFVMMILSCFLIINLAACGKKGTPLRPSEVEQLTQNG